jgi:hypothetical protein
MIFGNAGRRDIPSQQSNLYILFLGAFQVNYEVKALQTPAHAGTIPFLWQEYSQTNTLSK